MFKLPQLQFGHLGVSRITEDFIQEYRGADQAQVGECLREVTQLVSFGSNLLGEHTEVVCVGKCLLEQEPCLFNIPCPGDAFHVLEGMPGFQQKYPLLFRYTHD